MKADDMPDDLLQSINITGAMRRSPLCADLSSLSSALR
jgi:hypothetical protein